MLNRERIMQIVGCVPDMDVFIHSESLGIMVERDMIETLLGGHDKFELRIDGNGINIIFK